MQGLLRGLPKLTNIIKNKINIYIYRRTIIIIEKQLNIFTCQVNASPLAFSDSNSLDDRGNEFLHKRSIRGKSPLTTLTPEHINTFDVFKIFFKSL